MADDFRISVGFFRHHKTRKLERRLGVGGVVALLRLWDYAAEFRPKGDLSGMTAEDIELAADWNQDAHFVTVLVEVGFLDEDAGGYVLHDWQAHNPWVAEADERSASARLSRLHRENPEMAAQLKAEGRTGLTAEEYRTFKRGTTVQRPYNDRTTTVDRGAVTPAPAPAPAPAPEPDPGKKRRSSAKASKRCPAKTSPAFDEFWSLYPSRNGQKTKKAKAWEVFWKLTSNGSGVSPELLIERIRILAPTYGDFPRDAVTWLNQRGWEDEVGPIRIKSAAQGQGLRPSKAQVLQEQNVAAMNEWLATKGVQE
jgi:hypothetical protein